MTLTTSALLIIDVQKAFDDQRWGERNNPRAEEKIADLIQAFRLNQQTLIHVQHLNDDPDSLFYPTKETVDFKREAQPLDGEIIIQKKVNSAFIGTDLETILQHHGIKNLFICGLTTPHCVSTTTRMAANLGFNCYLIEDSTAAFPLVDHRGQIHSAAEIQRGTLASLHQEFAEIVATKDVLNLLQT